MITASQRLQYFGAAFIFRPSSQSYQPRKVWQSFAYDICHIHPSIRSSIYNILEHVDGSDLNTHDTFENLVLNPLKNASSFFSTKGLLFIIDGIDQCSRTSQEWDELLGTIAMWSAEMPPIFKLLLVSWPLVGLSSALKHPNFISLELIGDSSRDNSDIQKYLEHKFSLMQTKAEDSPYDWPGSHSIAILTLLSAGNFFWARSIVHQIINANDPKDELTSVLSKGYSVKCEEIDLFYEDVVFTCVDGEYLPIYRDVLGFVALAKRKLSLSSLTELLDNTEAKIRVAIGTLSPILILEEEPSQKVFVRYRHQSFADYFLNPAKSNEIFNINRNSMSRRLTQECFRVMLNKLRFNFSGISSSYGRLNASDPKFSVSPALTYSCRFWAVHLLEMGEQPDAEIISKLDNFLKRLLLSWLEVLSYAKLIDVAPQLLAMTSVYIKVPAFPSFINCHSNDLPRRLTRTLREYSLWMMPVVLC